jgi:hypothetical protein
MCSPINQSISIPTNSKISGDRYRVSYNYKWLTLLKSAAAATSDSCNHHTSYHKGEVKNSTIINGVFAIFHDGYS